MTYKEDFEQTAMQRASQAWRQKRYAQKEIKPPLSTELRRVAFELRMEANELEKTAAVLEDAAKENFERDP